MESGSTNSRYLYSKRQPLSAAVGLPNSKQGMERVFPRRQKYDPRHVRTGASIHLHWDYPNHKEVAGNGLASVVSRPIFRSVKKQWNKNQMMFQIFTIDFHLL